MSLPTEKSKQKLTLNDLTVLLYGPSKIGKSTWCSHADSAIFLSTEPGLNALEVYQSPTNNWEEFLACCGELSEGKHKFKTIIIDTIDNAYRFCADHINKKFGVDHESDIGYGKGYQLIMTEFQRVITKLAFLPYGLIMVSHSIERDIETRTGKQTRIMPTLPDKPRKYITGLVDMILFCDLDIKTGNDGNTIYTRVLRTKPHTNYDAGDRTSLLPDVLPLDFNAFAASLSQTKTGATKS